MITHFGWARVGKNWRLVATGASAAEAHRELMRWVKEQPRPPVASAVLPAGVHPAGQDERHGHAERRGGPGAVEAQEGR
jgi:hypothetical protein